MPLLTSAEVAVVIRSFNNPDVIKRVKSLRSMFTTIIVVTDNERDKGATRAWLKELNDPCVRLIEMMTGYSWSNALNRALHLIGHINTARQFPLEFAFNVSVEALFERRHFEAMMTHFASPEVAVVGTSFQGVCEGNRVSLGRSYRHPRNTGMLIRLSSLEHRMIRDFDPFCDDVGGMEDIDFIYRLQAFAGLKSRMVDEKVPLLVGRHYNQSQKEEREREAMKRIFARYKQWADELNRAINDGWQLMED